MQRREFLVLASLLIVGCASKPSAPPEVAGMRFSDAERKKIVDFYGQTSGKPGSLPAQRAKVGDLLDSGQRPNKLPVDGQSDNWLWQVCPHTQPQDIFNPRICVVVSHCSEAPG